MTRRLTPEAATQAALTKQRKANKAAAIDAQASEALSAMVEGNDPEQALRIMGRKLGERLRAVVGDTETSTFFQKLAGAFAPKDSREARFAKADADLGIKGRGA